MMARRLLGRGGGSSFAPLTTAAFTLLSTTDGGLWTDIPDNRAWYAAGKTFFGFVHNSTGDVRVTSYDHTTGAVASAFVLNDAVGDNTGPGIDLHDSPSIITNSDGKLVAAYSAHGGTNPLVRVSTNAHDVSAWAAEQSVGSAGSVTYMTLLSLADGTIYLFYRQYTASTFHLAYRTSTTGGTSWSAETLLWKSTQDGTYWRIATNGTRIDITATDTLRTVAIPSALYHFYLSGANAYTSDGTLIGAGRPFTEASATLIKSAADGPIQPGGIGYGTDGRPWALMQVWDDGNARNSIRTARWNGSAWTTAVEVAHSNGVIAGNRFISSSTIRTSDPTVVYLSRKVGSIFEIWRYATADSGATWSGTAVTAGSIADNMLPADVTNSPGVMRAIWARGSYTNDLTFSVAIIGGR